MSEPAVRPSSQELADRVRNAFWNSRHIPAAEEALGVLAARLQATEQALRHYADEDNWEDHTPGPEVNTAGYPVFVYAGDYPWTVARRALEGAAE